METRATVVVGPAVLSLVGAGLVVAAPMLPGIPDGPVAVRAGLLAVLALASGLVDWFHGEREVVPAGAGFALKLGLTVAAGSYLVGWLAETVRPLAWAGGVLIGIGLARVLAVVTGRADPVPAEQPGPDDDDIPDAVFMTGWGSARSMC
jgi:hypothetical protein